MKIYNDNNATTPTATRAGITALAREKNVVLIMGGAGKDLDMSPLLAVIPQHCKTVVLLPGTGTDRIREGLSGIPVTSLDEAVTTALEHAAAGDVVLFSPAFASFGLFKNEYDRGDQFVATVRKVLADQ